MALEHHSRLLSALARGMTLEEEALHIAQMQAAAAAAAASTRSCRQQQQQQDTNMQTQQPAGGASEATREQQETGGGTAGGAVMRAAAAASARQNVRQDAFADRFISEEDILQVELQWSFRRFAQAKSFLSKKANASIWLARHGLMRAPCIC
jgi:hypothetical protein